MFYRNILSMDFIDLVNSLFPSLKGEFYDKLRKAIAYQLISVGKSGSFRNSIHILLMGNPGTGKTYILNYVSKIPGNVYVSGQTTTKVGLLGGYIKGKIKPGIAGNVAGVLCFDEIDKASKYIKDSLNELMENLRVTISIAGSINSYDVNLAILAASNPKYGILKEGDYIRQIDLPQTVIDRFDLIFITRYPIYTSLSDPDLNYDEILAYLNRVRGIDPEVSNIDTKLDFIYDEAYFSVRRKNTIIRLAKAIAKSYNDNVVKEEYINEALKFFIDIMYELLGYKKPW